MKTKSAVITACVGASFMLLTLGCGNEEAFQGDNNLEAKPLSRYEGNSSNLQEDPEQKPTVEILFSGTLTTNSGIVLCEGDVIFQILNTLQMFEVGKTAVRCGSTGFDMEGFFGDFLMKGMENMQSPSKMIKNLKSGKAPPITHDGKAMYMSALPLGEFDEPVPFMIGPIIQEENSFFKDLDIEVDTTLTAKHPNTGVTMADTGTVRLVVEDHDMDYQNENMKDPMPGVIHMRRTAEGFEDTFAMAGMLFPEMEAHIRPYPLMLGSFKIVIPLKNMLKNGREFMGGGMMQQLPGGLDPGPLMDLASEGLGDLTVELKLKDYKYLDD